MTEKVRRQRLELAISRPRFRSELYTQDDFRQPVVAIEATPAFLGCRNEAEDRATAAPRPVAWWDAAFCQDAEVALMVKAIHAQERPARGRDQGCHDQSNRSRTTEPEKRKILDTTRLAIRNNLEPPMPLHEGCAAIDNP